MALAGGLPARAHVPRDSGASGYFYASSARLVGAVDDSIFLSRWAAGISYMDDAGIVVRFWHRLGALLCVDSTAVEHLSAGRNRHSGRNLSSQRALSIKDCCLLAEGCRVPFTFTNVFAVGTGSPGGIDSIVNN